MARSNDKGYTQIDQEHYDTTSIIAPLTDGISGKIVMTLVLVVSQVGWIVDVNGTYKKVEVVILKDIYESLERNKTACLVNGKKVWEKDEMEIKKVMSGYVLSGKGGERKYRPMLAWFVLL